MQPEKSNAPAKKGKSELAVYSLNQPDQLGSLAGLVQQHIEQHKLYTPIQGKKYVNVEGWQFAGAMLGLVPLVESVVDTSTHQQHTFKGYQGKPDTVIAAIEFRATVGLLDLRTGNTVGRGIASCSNLESRKRTFDPYAVESMAQMRAVGKAFRLLIGWLMQAGGYATTPAEEMPDAEPETSAVVVAPEPPKKAPAEAVAPASVAPAQSIGADQNSAGPDIEQLRRDIINAARTQHITRQERSKILAPLNTYTVERAQKCLAYIEKTAEQRMAPGALDTARLALRSFANANATKLGEEEYNRLHVRAGALTVTAADLIQDQQDAAEWLQEGGQAA